MPRAQEDHDFDPKVVDPRSTELFQAQAVVDDNPDLRWTPGHGWLAFDGARWAREADGRIEEAVRAAAEAAMFNYPKFGHRFGSRRSLDDVRTIAQTLTRIDTAELDAHPDLLHAAGTTWNLRTGESWPTKPAEFNTRACTIAAADGCPEWLAALDRCFPGEPEMVDYLQRLVGYGIMGGTKRVFVLLHGKGANGKSTFIETLSHVFGQYVQHVPVEVLMNTAQRNGESPSPMLVSLQGARMVFTAETERGGRLNEPMVKLLTGGDQITARALRRDPITFRPEALVFMATNHKPEIQGTDDGIWRRVKLIEWRESFIGRQDNDIQLKLNAEAPGILRWALDGALKVMIDGGGERGLQEPERVTLATRAFRDDSDFLGAFVPDWIDPDPTCRISREEIRMTWEAFCEANGAGGNPLRNMTTLYRALEERGAQAYKSNGVRGYFARRVR